MAAAKERYRFPLRTVWVARLKAAIQVRQSGGDRRPAAEILHDVVERYISRGLARREGNRLVFKDPDD